MSKIVSIATAVPAFEHQQEELFRFADTVFSNSEEDSRKLKFLYNHSGINKRYSVLPDFNVSREERTFFPTTANLEPFPTVEQRLAVYNDNAAALSVTAIHDCIHNNISTTEITHLITVSCTGISAPGLDLQIMEQMGLPSSVTRTSVNFMGCYAAVHAMKLADAFCTSAPNSNVIVVCTELCTLHFQKEKSIDNITSSLLFGDGCAAMLIQPDQSAYKGIRLNSFFSDVSFKGKNEMAWEISSKGFLMTLSGYVPALIKEDFKTLVEKALHNAGKKKEDITHWCIHPGGKQIVQSIGNSMELNEDALQYAYDVLKDYGNMSSATIVFVLQKILATLQQNPSENVLIFGAAFGPGLTMETFTATYA